MMPAQLHIGERVGIKDGAGFHHWSRFGVITGIADGSAASDGRTTTFTVLEDGERDAYNMASTLLVGLGLPGEQSTLGAWSAQAFPTDGDPPGPVMHFANATDVLKFVVEFADGKLDEKLQVYGPAWTDEERTRLLDAGIVPRHNLDENCPVTLADELAKLATLQRQGSLSEAEFQAAKARLLSP
ncbi:MAG TPA: SHOCT domain-containing protein [Acetobacteraceae bacterium]|nr:SHOCT domain-containing protein [Acetobacteraceae bacterium]